MSFFQSRTYWQLERQILVFGAAIAIFGFAAREVRAIDVFDDFSDLNDTVNPAWTHLDGAVASTLQTWNASTGAYHLTAPSNSQHPLLTGYGFVGAYTGPCFTDVRVSADFIDFPGAASPSGGFMGVMARMNGDNRQPTAGVGITLRGYSYQYEAQARGGLGEMVLNAFIGDGFKDIGSDPVSLDSSRDYRFILEVVGNTLHGQTWEIDANGVQLALVGEKFRDLDAQPVGNIDDDGDNSTPDVPFVPYTSGYSGVYGVGHVFAMDVDFTADNFRAESLALAGDFNGDHAVDGNDLAQWRGSFKIDMSADGDLDCDSDGNDLLIWQRQLGATPPPPASASVPEPCALGLSCAAAIALLGRRRGDTSPAKRRED